MPPQPVSQRVRLIRAASAAHKTRADQIFNSNFVRVSQQSAEVKALFQFLLASLSDADLARGVDALRILNE